jgi:ParB family chromosome partitioning protein
MAAEKARRLGRGLDALISSGATGSRNEIRFPGTVSAEPDGFRRVAVSQIVANPLQPRKAFDEAELAELRASIAANGLLQPLLVRPRGTHFELVAGERRLRAIQGLGWQEVPVQVRELDDQEVLTLALIENLQRSDLDPIEEAEGYQDLISRFSLTQQQVADAVGRDRSTIANTLRLLALPETVRGMVRSGELSLGHARTLLGLTTPADMESLARAVVAEGLTVREVERRVREAGAKTTRRQRKGRSDDVPPPAMRPPELRLMEEQLRKRFQTDVAVSASSNGRGEVRLSFYSPDDLERLLDILLGPNREVA